jgi:hypothetical protein
MITAVAKEHVLNRKHAKKAPRENLAVSAIPPSPRAIRTAVAVKLQGLLGIFVTLAGSDVITANVSVIRFLVLPERMTWPARVRGLA